MSGDRTSLQEEDRSSTEAGGHSPDAEPVWGSSRSPSSGRPALFLHGHPCRRQGTEQHPINKTLNFGDHNLQAVFGNGAALILQRSCGTAGCSPALIMPTPQVASLVLNCHSGRKLHPSRFAVRHFAVALAAASDANHGGESGSRLILSRIPAAASDQSRLRRLQRKPVKAPMPKATPIA